jgi:hypothetical protein
MMAYGGEDVHLHVFLISALDPAYLPVEWGVFGCGGEEKVLSCEPVNTLYTDRAVEAVFDDHVRARLPLV